MLLYCEQPNCHGGEAFLYLDAIEYQSEGMGGFWGSPSRNFRSPHSFVSSKPGGPIQRYQGNTLENWVSGKGGKSPRNQKPLTFLRDRMKTCMFNSKAAFLGTDFPSDCRNFTRKAVSNFAKDTSGYKKTAPKNTALGCFA